MKKSISLLFILISFTHCFGQKTELKLNLQKGKEYKHIMHAQSNIVQQMFTGETTMQLVMKVTLSYRVTDVTNTGYQMDVVYERLQMAVGATPTTQGADSNVVQVINSEKTDTDDSVAIAVRAVINKPFQIEVTKTGRITAVKNLESILQVALQGVSANKNNNASPLKDLLVGAFGEEKFKESFELITAIYPEKTVSPGDTWVTKLNMQSTMPVNITTTFKYVESHRQYEVIAGISTITPKNKGFEKVDGMYFKKDLTGEMSSTIKIDKASGWVVESVLRQDIKGAIIMKQNPKSPDDIKMPMAINNDITYTNH
jgi:hypothetical protein